MVKNTGAIFGLLIVCLLSFNLSAASNESQGQHSNYFSSANKLLQQTNQFELRAKQSLLDANQTRQSISQLRVKIRKEKQAEAKIKLSDKATKLANLLESQQANGAKFRLNSKAAMKDAMDLFEQGLSESMGAWVSNRQPLTMDKETLDYISHNTGVRSVHPTMLNKMGLNKSDENSAESSSRSKDAEQATETMTLKIAALVGQAAPLDLNISAFRISNKQQYIAHIEVHGSKQNDKSNVSQVPLNQMHQWRLIISDISGTPLTGANVSVAGHMPGHVHGLPTQPQVTEEIADGVYLIEGVKFQMQGWWVMEFEVNSKQVQDSNTDSLTFNLIL